MKKIVISEIESKQYFEMLRWCGKQYGPNAPHLEVFKRQPHAWHVTWFWKSVESCCMVATFTFKKEQDATFFSLRWT